MSQTVLRPVRLGRLPVGALGVLALALGTLQSVVDPALPLLQRELGLSPSQGALVANTVLVTGAVLTPVVGTLGDRHGGKRVLVRLMAVVTAGGLLAALAPGLPVLLLGQLLQGAMVGALPLSFILVRTHLPAGRSQAALGVVVALFTGGGTVGTLVAGPIAERLSWHWMFALPALAVGAAAYVVARTVPDDPPAASRDRVDWPGVLLLTGTLLAFMTGLVTLADGSLPPLAVGALAVAAAALASCWVAVERRAASPMVDLRMLARPAMWQACVLTLVVTAAFGMVAFLLRSSSRSRATATASRPAPPRSGCSCCPARSPERSATRSADSRRGASARGPWSSRAPSSPRARCSRWRPGTPQRGSSSWRRC